MGCTEDLHRKGPRLHATKAQMLEATYAEDLSMTILVKPQQPLLHITVHELVTILLAGEVVHLSLRLTNSGAHPMSNLRALCDQPSMCFKRDEGKALLSLIEHHHINAQQ